MGEELAGKKNVRRGHRASTTRILGQVDPAIASEPADVSKMNQLKRSLENKLQSLSALDEGLQSLSALDEGILSLTPASKHMDILMSITSDRNLKELRRLYDHTESHVRSLRSLGIEATSYGTLLSPVLLAKLPPDLRLIVSRKVSDSNLDIDALLSTFEEELR